MMPDEATRLLALIEAAFEVWTPCEVRELAGGRRGWCMTHQEYLRSTGCSMAVLGAALRAVDPARAAERGIPDPDTVTVDRDDLRRLLNLSAEVIEDWDPEETAAAQRLHVAVFGDPDA